MNTMYACIGAPTTGRPTCATAQHTDRNHGAYSPYVLTADQWRPTHRELNIDAEGIDIGPSPADAFVAEQLSTPIESLDLTVRSYNCLKREGIHTVGELIGRSEADLLDIRNFGAKSIDEVKVKLVSLGLALKDSPPGFDPSQVVSFYDDDDDAAFAEDEQY